MLFFWRTLISFWRDPAYRSLLFATNFFLAIGTVAYRFLEDWSWLDSLYFSVITLTTIGYGDFSPKTTLGKLFTMGLRPHAGYGAETSGLEPKKRS